MPRQRGIRRKVAKIWRTNGMKGFYQGLSPCLMRAGFSFGASFVALEYAKDKTATYFNLTTEENC